MIKKIKASMEKHYMASFLAGITMFGFAADSIMSGQSYLMERKAHNYLKNISSIVETIKEDIKDGDSESVVNNLKLLQNFHYFANQVSVGLKSNEDAKYITEDLTNLLKDSQDMTVPKNYQTSLSDSAFTNQLEDCLDKTVANSVEYSGIVDDKYHQDTTMAKLFGLMGILSMSITKTGMYFGNRKRRKQEKQK